MDGGPIYGKQLEKWHHLHKSQINYAFYTFP
jgi:hypothetical protein